MKHENTAAVLCRTQGISDPRAPGVGSNYERSNTPPQSRGKRWITVIALVALTARAPYASAQTEDEYSLPKSKVHLSECYKAVDDMKIGTVEQITGYHTRDAHHFRLTIRGEHGRVVIATCDSDAGTIVRIQEE